MVTRVTDWRLRRVGLLRNLVRRILAGGVRSSLAHLARHPDRFLLHGRRVLVGETTGLANRYGSSERSHDASWTCSVARVPQSEVLRVFDELDADDRFVSDLRARYAAVRPDWADSFDIGRFRSIYALVRLMAPGTVIETGVHDGLSTCMILKALAANRSGRLVSIDRPSPDLPIGVDGPGWLVPTALRDRWTLKAGDAVRLLPRAVAENAPIDVFLHDSDHSVSHRRFEFTTVIPALAERGIILSDDDEPGDGLLRGLAESWGMAYVAPPGERGLGALIPVDVRSPTKQPMSDIPATQAHGDRR